jgi:NTE family protein
VARAIVALFAIVLPLLADARPKIGLALGGGGARGGAHVGVLRALVAARVPVDYVAGTSIGAIIGALYATGRTPDEIQAFIDAIDWQSTFDDRVPRAERTFRRKQDDELALLQPGIGYRDGAFRLRRGLVLGREVQRLLQQIGRDYPAVRNFDELAIPFRAVATDIATGRAVVLGDGDLAEALRASMAVPALFSPVERGGRQLVDGGLANNLPVDVVRAMGADIVIAVDVGAPLLAADAIDSAVAVTEQLTNLLTRGNSERQAALLGDGDVLVVPALDGFGSTDFSRMRDMVAHGEAAALAAIAAAPGLGMPPADYAAHVAARHHGGAAPRIAFYRLRNDSRMPESALQRALRLDDLVGQPLDVDVVNAHFRTLYAEGVYERITYEAERDGDGLGIAVHVREKSWGPNYLGLRLLMDGDLTSRSGFSFGADYQATNLSRFLREWRTFVQLGDERLVFSEMYLPLRDWFVAPRVAHERTAQTVFDERGERVAAIDVLATHAQLAVGRELGYAGRVSAGVRRGAFDAVARVGVGDGVARSDNGDLGEAFVSLALDRFDDRSFPTSGFRLALEATRGDRDLGADSPFEQAELRVDVARAFANTHVLGRLRVAATLAGLSPVHRRARLGGFFALSGFQAGELTGQHAGLAGLLVFQRFATPLLATYAGVSVEYGNVWENESQVELDSGRVGGSIWVGARTPLGPAYLGYGITGDVDSLFLSIGRPL